MTSLTCYKILVFGEPGVGKTCFVDQYCFGKSFIAYIPDDSIGTHEIAVDGRCVKITLMDLSTSFLKPETAARYPEWAERMLREADGVVLLYDITSMESFEYITRQAYDFCGAAADRERRQMLVLSGTCGRALDVCSQVTSWTL